MIRMSRAKPGRESKALLSAALAAPMLFGSLPAVAQAA
jgi:hypothetical protein